MVQQLVARCWPCKAGVASRIFFKAGSVARWLLDPCAAWFGGRLCKGRRPYLTNARFTHVVFLVLGVLVIASGFWSLQQLALPNWLPEVCRTGTPLKVTLSGCNDEEWLLETICMAGFRASFRKDDELQHCGEATDLAFICKGNGEISEHWQRCTRDSKPMFSGSRLVTYNPRFDMISSKSSLCKAQNKASSELRVDFRFVPPCFVAESDVLDASIQVRAREAAGDNSMWVAKKDGMAMGDGIRFMTVPELADIRDFKAQTLQQAMLQVPTLHRRKLEMRHFFSVTSMDPPRIYVCRDGYYKTGGQRLVSEEQLRLIGVQNRSAFVVANSQSENMKRFMGPMQDLEEELSRQGLDVEDVETQIAEKIVRAFLAVADQTSCKNAEHPYHCEGYVAFGITDSSVDMTTKEAYLFEIMLVQEDWVFRGMSWGLAGVNANDVVRASLEQLARISLSRLRPEVSGINRTKWPTDLSDRAARLLADVQNREVVRNMLIEAEQAKGTQCACPICEDTAKFVDFFPNKAETTSFGHPWLAFYELYRAAQAGGGSSQNRR